MTKRFFRHKLLFDENFPVRSYFPLLNSRFDIKHIVEDYNLSGISDLKVYELAKRESRLLLTRNVKDFMDLAETSRETGVIGVSPKLLPQQMDKKLTALLIRSTKKALFGKLTQINAD